MKTKNLIMILSCCISAFGCASDSGSADENEEKLPTDFIVAGFDDCGLKFDDGYVEAQGYLLVTADKDTFLTYKFPDDVFRFPEEVFKRVLVGSSWFDETARKTLKFRVEYEIVPEDEEYYPFRNAQDPWIFKNNGYRQIIVTSATKID
jgi:hypothetical protein